MPMQIIKLDNQQARHLWLHLQGLLEAPLQGSADKHSILPIVRQLGMVQLDSIPNIVRAHHHILWSRHNGYREHHYNELLGHSPDVFEHFSHDAAILPLELYPYWQRQRQRRSRAFTRGALGEQLPASSIRKQLVDMIRQQGPMCSRDFASVFTKPADKSRHAWMRPPHKQALDYLWLKGDLCVSHRKNFIKYYELTKRVVPEHIRQMKIDVKTQIDTLCTSALQRLGFGTARDIQAFYEACTLDEVKQWLQQFPQKHQSIQVHTHNGRTLSLLARPDLEDILDELTAPHQSIRVINPFDPVVRDRKKLRWLFGMDYKIEVYVPAHKRRFGYYVYPLIENASMIGRIDVSANRKQDTLEVNHWWLEPKVRTGKARTQRLAAELKRLAKVAGVSQLSDIPEPENNPWAAPDNK